MLRLLVWLEGHKSVCVEAFAALPVGQGGGHVAEICVQRWGCQCSCWVCE